MSNIDFAKVCMRFREKLSVTFIERIERRLGESWEKVLEEKPKDLLVAVLQDIRLYYVNPYEMILEMSELLKQTYGISCFSLSFSERYDFPISEKIEEASKIVNSFYEMTESLGFGQMFMRSTRRWWKYEF